MGYREIILATPNLYAYWPLGDALGVIHDIGPNGINLVAANNTTFGVSGGLAGSADKAIQLDGVNSYLSTLSNVTGDFTGGMSIEMLIYPTGATGDYERFIDFAGSGGGGVLNFMVYRVQQTNQLSFDVWDTNGHAVFNSTTNCLTNNTWNHIVCTVDGSGNAKIYKNGAVNNTKIGMQRPIAGTRVLNYIGKSQFGTDAYYHGKNDEYSIYTRALSDGEVTARWNAINTVLPSLGKPLIQVAWNPDYDGIYPDQWFQAFADISADVIHVRARCRVFQGRITPDQAWITVDNDSKKYTPMNSGTPINSGRLLLQRPVRIIGEYNGVQYPVFYGLLKRIEPALEQSDGTRKCMFTVDSPIQVDLNDQVLIPAILNPCPYDPTNLNASLLPYVFGTSNIDFATDTTVLADDDGSLLSGKKVTKSKILSQIGRYGGKLWVQPKIKLSNSDPDYTLVYRKRDHWESLADEWDWIDTNGDFMHPEASYSDEGLG